MRNSRTGGQYHNGLVSLTCRTNVSKKTQEELEVLTMRLYEFPVLEFAEPVDWTPVSNPPFLGVHGESKVDSRMMYKSEIIYHRPGSVCTSGTVLDSLGVLDVLWE
jgi:hypothetical protein